MIVSTSSNLDNKNVQEQQSYFSSLTSKLFSAKRAVTRIAEIAWDCYQGWSMGTNPLAGVVIPATKEIFKWAGNIFIKTGYTEKGVRRGEAMVIGDNNLVNHDLAHQLEQLRKQMGLAKHDLLDYLIFEPLPWDSTLVMKTTSLPLSACKRIECHPIFFFDKGLINDVLTVYDAKERQTIRELRSNKAYTDFVGTQALTAVSENHYLWRESVGLLTLLGSGLLVHYFSSQEQESSWSFTLLSGLAMKLLADTSKALCNRYLTYRADEKAVEITQDPAAAAACLKLLERAMGEKRSIYDKLLTALWVLLTESGKEEFFSPSFQNRIKNLRSPVFTVPDFPEENYPMVDMYRAVEMYQRVPEVKLYMAIERMGEKGWQLLKEALPYAKKVPPKLFQWYVRGNMHDPRLLSLMAFGSMLMTFYPHLYTQITRFAPQQLSGGSVSIAPEEWQNKIREMAKEMGITKPIWVWLHENAASPHYCRGIGQGPGAAEIMTMPMEGPMQEFVLRHELAHLYHGDLLKISMIYYSALILTCLGLEALRGPSDSMIDQTMRGALADAIASVAFYAYSRYMESRADKTAITASSSAKGELIQGGVELFRIFQKANLQARDQNALNRLLISEKGENRLDFDHPSLEGRIQELQKDQ
ncbi:MAG: M48 family metalloprotease [Verrucomicrobia bacterium]|nr:M48 family metalloprotease [Verrucomicrobiota bacterium]